MVRRYEAYREDTIETSAFKQYTKKHYESWVTFAERYGDVKPVLVSGFDVTKDWAITAYSNNDTSIESDLSISVPMLGSTSESFCVTKSTTGSPYFTCGPRRCVPPSSVQSHYMSSTKSTGADSDDYNQCVFIRYYTMRKRMGLFPKVIKGSAGPHDLRPGNNDDATFPELTAQQDQTSDHEDDVTSGGEERDLIAEDVDSDPDIVVYSGPDVGYSS